MTQIDKIGSQLVKQLSSAVASGVALRQLIGQNLRIGGGALTGEAHADVGRGPIVDGGSSEQQGDG